MCLRGFENLPTFSKIVCKRSSGWIRYDMKFAVGERNVAIIGTYILRLVVLYEYDYPSYV